MKTKPTLTPNEQATYDEAKAQMDIALKVMIFNGDPEPMRRAIDLLHSIPVYKPTRWQRIRSRIKVNAITFYDLHVRGAHYRIGAAILRAYLKIARQ